MDDPELDAALRACSDAWNRYTLPPAMQGMEPALSARARAAIDKLEAEARRVRGPGGPPSNYSAVLDAGAAATHPEIDRPEMHRHILGKLIFNHR